ncbi:MAG: polysaccharide biosynthesis protein [Desulfohalobiaceae bacterium]
MLKQLSNIKFWMILAADLILFCAAHILAYVIRFDGMLPPAQWQNIQMVLPWLVLAKFVIFYFFGLYQGMWRYSSLVDLLAALKATLIITTVALSAVLLFNRFEGFSRSVFILDGLFTFLAVCGNRLAIRLYHQKFPQGLHSENHLPASSKKKLLILGAGDAAEKVAREVFDNPSLPYRILGFLDDDPSKIGKRIHGLSVMASTADVRAAAEKSGAQELLIAMPSADREQISRVVENSRASGLPFKTLPSLGEIINDKVSIKAIREVSYKDLLGRPPVKLENQEILKVVQGQTVLITGAGGSIGSELCRQILRFDPGLMIFLEASEENLYRLEMEVLHEHQFSCYATVLGKVQDRELLDSVFQQYQPNIVLHAAAYKHVPLIENNPWEAVYNNVFASHRLIQAAIKHQADRFILVSTDKAVRPTNVMGASKRLTEMLMLAHCQNTQTKFMAVRFGNVLGSSGSVIPLFRRQIEKGGPVTVTHPDITRFFMSIEEASQLILQAAAMGKGGEIFVLEMGTPVRIAQMARDFIRLCGKEPDTEIEIKYMGLRPGEKLYEELITEGEDVLPTRHEKIMVLRGESQDVASLRGFLDKLKGCASRHDAQGIKTALQEAVPEYTPKETRAVLERSDFELIKQDKTSKNAGSQLAKVVNLRGNS